MRSRLALMPDVRYEIPDSRCEIPDAIYVKLIIRFMRWKMTDNELEDQKSIVICRGRAYHAQIII